MHERVIQRMASRSRTALRSASVILLCLSAGPAIAQSTSLGAAGELVDTTNLRVCADPDNLPYSNESGEGFENKIAALIAEKLGLKSVVYTWYPMSLGFVRNTLGANRCDVVIGFAQGDELVQNTNAYYRTAYALVYERGKGLDDVETTDDPRLAGKSIGVVATTPPASNLALNGLMARARAYPLMIDTRLSPSMGKVMIDDLLSGTIDVAILWGPMAGYYAARSGADLAVVPLVAEKAGSRMIYDITMGVRSSDQEWKRKLNRFITENRAEIDRILIEYNVPLIDQQDRPTTQ
jgi:quinoprotein dehydrogenase-associated probable ABC transporter substrate-binding protein